MMGAAGSLPAEINCHQPRFPGTPWSRSELVGLRTASTGNASRSGTCPGVGFLEAGCLRADCMFMNVPSVGTGDSSSSSEMVKASSGSDLHILQRVFSFQTWLWLRITVLISVFIALTPLAAGMGP